MKTKLLFSIFAAIIILVIACRDKEDKKVEPNATVETADADDSLTIESLDTMLSRENIDTFSTMAFHNYAKKQSTGFDWSRFRMESNWIDSSPLTTSYKPDKNFYDAYGRFVKYSPDSTMFIDLDSYNVDIRKDESGRWRGTEQGPDTEISLVNLKTGTKTRVLFLGPGNSIEDALWLDKENIAIMGIEDYDSLGKVAAVWKYNIPTNSYYLYELKDSVAARRLMGYWRRERLKGVVMN